MVALAIVAGGQARRMGGQMKSFLMVEGRSIIDRQLSVLRPLFETMVIVAGDRQAFADRGVDVEVIPDRVGPGLGPLAGLDAALAWLPSSCQAVVCVAGDMPFLVPGVLRHVRDLPPTDALAVVPRLGSAAAPRLQPLCARYHRSVAPLAAAELRAGNLSLRSFLERIPTLVSPVAPLWIEEGELRRLDPTLATFTNVNEPVDLIRRR